jgi:Na+-transporting methylmalonyl-CoA/oxaloacetate decarboxylase gamma subunit
MLHNLSNALIITGIGMGLVFLALLLLWVIMALVIKIKDPVEASEEETEEPLVDASLEVAPAIPASDRKRRAAAAAVAIALSLRKITPTGLSGHAPSVATGGWQTSIRANNISRRANLFSRKPRG